MSQSSISANQQNTQEIHPDQWIPFLAEFTREYRGAHARLEVIGAPEVGDAVQTENRPFEGVSADIKDRERTVWLAFASTPDNHFSHSVSRATVIRMLPPTENRGPVLEIEAADGSKTILSLTNSEEYELPPARTQRPPE